MTEPAIRAEQLSKIYPLYDHKIDRFKESLHPLRKKYHHDFYALKDVSFEVQKGETVGIIGKNGSGKSTLLKILSGVLTPSSGTYKVSGRVASLLELGTGFNPELTGIENIYFNATLLGLSKKEIDEKLDRIIAFADIGEFVRQPVKIYSSGMFVRLAFAVAINADPEILIVDEALAVGDIRFQVKCFRKIEEFCERKKTVLFASHSTDDVRRLCQKTVWLDDGVIKKSGASKKVLEEYHAFMIHDTTLQVATQQPEDSDDNELSAMACVPENACITGEGGAVVRRLGLFDKNNNRLRVLGGSQKVRLVFDVFTKVQLNFPLFAFQLLNSRGLRVLGSNTYVLQKSIESIPADYMTKVSFQFLFPEIENGKYLVALGVADGTQETHIRHQFISDALEIEMQSPSVMQKQSVLLKLSDCMVDIKSTRKI